MAMPERDPDYTRHQDYDSTRDPFAERARRGQGRSDSDEPYRGSEDRSGFSRIADDLGRLMTDAVGVADGMRREVDGVIKSQAERLVRGLDVVTREEFEAVRDMAIKARDENERLERKLAELEARLGPST